MLVDLMRNDLTQIAELEALVWNGLMSRPMPMFNIW